MYACFESIAKILQSSKFRENSNQRWIKSGERTKANNDQSWAMFSFVHRVVFFGGCLPSFWDSTRPFAVGLRRNFLIVQGYVRTPYSSGRRFRLTVLYTCTTPWFILYVQVRTGHLTPVEDTRTRHLSYV
jgi:hypothetical protein